MYNYGQSDKTKNVFTRATAADVYDLSCNLAVFLTLFRQSSSLTVTTMCLQTIVCFSAIFSKF